jgi:hypothetical protein
MLKYVVLAIALLSVFARPAYGQALSALISAGNSQRIAAEKEALNDGGPNDFRQRLERTAAAHIIAERQAQLQRDTEKLVALTAQLKEHVAKAGPNVLSMDVVKKAAEIQKLAKSVEDKMKNPY